MRGSGKTNWDAGVEFVSWRNIDERSLSPASQIPVAILSLDDQTDRRHRLCQRGILADWVLNHWRATDLRHMGSVELHETLGREGYRFDPTWPSSVIGCAVSHGKAAEWQVRARRPLMLVLEDDAVPAVADYLKRLAALANTLLPAAQAGEAFVCHLGARPEQLREAYSRPVALGGYANDQEWSLRLHIDPRPTLWRAHAYLISLAAAQNSARRDVQLLAVADDWCARREQSFFDRLYVFTPRLFLQDEDVTSTLDHSLDAITQTHNVKRHGFLERVRASLTFRSRMALARVLSRIPTSI